MGTGMPVYCNCSQKFGEKFGESSLKTEEKIIEKIRQDVFITTEIRV